MHGIDLSHPTHFYVDVSGFGAGLAITQKPTTELKRPPSLEAPIIYDYSYPYGPQASDVFHII